MLSQFCDNFALLFNIKNFIPMKAFLHFTFCFIFVLSFCHAYSMDSGSTEGSKYNFHTLLNDNPKSYVVGQMKDGTAVLNKKPGLLKALRKHYNESLKINDVRIMETHQGAYLIATAKEKNGQIIEISFQLLKKGNKFHSTMAASESCSGCIHCAFAQGGGCVCVDDGSCIHTTTKDSNLNKILETQSF